MKKKVGICFLVLVIVYLTSVSVSYATVADGDNDGVPDAQDKCPNSQSTVVDQFGCSCEQKTANNCASLYSGAQCCVSDNNPCTDDCTTDNVGKAVCNYADNNNACDGGSCYNGGCRVIAMPTINNTNESFPTNNTPPRANVTANITANDGDSTITVPYGSSVKITWNSTNADSCDVYRGTNTDRGNLAWSDTGNTRYVTITSDTVFRLICTGPGGAASDETTVRPDETPVNVTADKCAGVECLNTPDSRCDGNIWVNYSSQCNPSNGKCEYLSANYTCPNGCKDGACVNNSPTCGNGNIDSGEVCDGNNLNGKSCQTQGFSGGILKCAFDCHSFGTSQCSALDNQSTGTNTPSLSLKPQMLAKEDNLELRVSNAAENSNIFLSLRNSDGQLLLNNQNIGRTGSNGNFEKTISADKHSDWPPGEFIAWVVVNGIKSNEARIQIVAETNISGTATSNYDDLIEEIVNMIIDDDNLNGGLDKARNAGLVVDYENYIEGADAPALITIKYPNNDKFLLMISRNANPVDPIKFSQQYKSGRCAYGIQAPLMFQSGKFYALPYREHFIVDISGSQSLKDEVDSVMAKFNSIDGIPHLNAVGGYLLPDIVIKLVGSSTMGKGPSGSPDMGDEMVIITNLEEYTGITLLKRAVIRINEDYFNGKLKKEGSDCLISVIMHEMGHVYGLDEDYKNGLSIMAAGCNSPNYISPEVKAALQMAYSNKQFPDMDCQKRDEYYKSYYGSPNIPGNPSPSPPSCDPVELNNRCAGQGTGTAQCTPIYDTCSCDCVPSFPSCNSEQLIQQCNARSTYEMPCIAYFTDCDCECRCDESALAEKCSLLSSSSKQTCTPETEGGNCGCGCVSSRIIIPGDGGSGGGGGGGGSGDSCSGFGSYNGDCGAMDDDYYWYGCWGSYSNDCGCIDQQWFSSGCEAD